MTKDEKKEVLEIIQTAAKETPKANHRRLAEIQVMLLGVIASLLLERTDDD